MKSKKLWLGMLMLFAMAICYGGKLVPQKKGGIVELFNTERNKAKVFYHRCAPWIKGDLTPVLADVENKDGKWVKFSYTGSKGMGQANFSFSPKVLQSLLSENSLYDGIKIGIYHAGKNFFKIGISLRFADKTILVRTLTLKQGYHEYLVKSGFRRAKFPPKWNLLRSVDFIKKSSKEVKESFLLKKIFMLTKEVKLQKKNLKIIHRKKIVEILKTESPLCIDNKISQQAWQIATPLRSFVFHKSGKQISASDSPLRARLTYNNKYLYVGTKAYFADAAPIKDTTLKGPHEKLWADELLEYFFSAENDNQKKIQFVTNLNGVVWDSVVEFDVVAAAVIRKSKKWSLEHKKDLSFKDNTWTTNAVFPLQKLKIDLKENRFMGFQLAQNYSKSSQDIVWAKTKKFPNPENFGILVFNRKAFGKGEISIKKLVSSSTPNASNIDVKLSVDTENFTPDTYKYSVTVAQSDATIVKDSGSIKLGSGSQTKHIKINNLKNLNGTYTIYLSIYNKNNDIKLVAVNVENSKDFLNKFGEKVFTVTPKKVIWSKGVFSVAGHNKLYIGNKPTARTLKTAEIFAKKLYAYSGKKYQIVKGTGNDGFTLKIGNKADFKGKRVSLKKEGYVLKVSPQNVTITGADEAGLYYGFITFIQMLRMPMNIKDSVPAACVEILDWPDKNKRILCLLHSWNFPSRATKEDRGINYLINWLDRYVAGNKLNAAVLDLSSLIKYKRHPEFNKRQAMYSLDDIKKLGKYCRDNFIDFIPRWQTGGHSNWWLTVIHPELREKGSKAQADVTHPEYSKIVFDCIKDVLEVSGAKYINAGMDEWWHGWKKGETPDKLLHGKTRAEALRDWVIQLNNFCRKNKVKLIMEGDMLYPDHNGTRFNAYKVINKIPRDIIITNWGILDGATKYFHDKGFKTLTIVTGEAYPNTAIKLVEGMGPNCYAFTSFNATKLNYAAVCTRYADFSWNCYSDKKGKSRDCMSSGALLAAMENLAVLPNPYASERIDTLNLQNAFSESFAAILKRHYPKSFALNKEVLKKVPTGKNVIGNIPMLLGDKTKNCLLMGKSKETSIAINRKCSSLIFLHTALGDMKQIKAWDWRNWYYGFPAGDYRVYYSDGSVKDIPLRLHDNIYTCNCSPLTVAILGCRYIMALKNVNGNYNFVYQYEWVNPCPEKKIKRIKYVHDGVYNFEIALLGLSTRQVKK